MNWFVIWTVISLTGLVMLASIAVIFARSVKAHVRRLGDVVASAGDEFRDAKEKASQVERATPRPVDLEASPLVRAQLREVRRVNAAHRIERRDARRHIAYDRWLSGRLRG